MKNKQVLTYRILKWLVVHQLFAIVFKSGASSLTAATQICICESCKGEYESCHEFMKYTFLNITQLNQAWLLRSNTENATTETQEVDETVADLLVPGSFVANT